MTDYKKLYYTLFNRITDALEELEQRDYGQAAETLKSAQLETEELYIEAGEKSAE